MSDLSAAEQKRLDTLVAMLEDLRKDILETDITDALHQWYVFKTMLQSLDIKDMVEAEAHCHAVGFLASYLDVWDDNFTRLYGAIHTELWYWRCAPPEEREYYPLFEEALPTLIPGATIDTTVKKKRGVPDFFVRINGNIAPVEIKRGDINGSAVSQLARYMDEYKSTLGYLIGHSITKTALKQMRPTMRFCAWKPL